MKIIICDSNDNIMDTMKSYTDLEQSKKLAEILPLESADMYWWSSGKRYYIEAMDDGDFNEREGHVRAWSLAALLDILNKTAYFMDEDASVNLSSYKTIEWDLGIDNSDLELVTESNPVDACYEMIIKLHELNLL